MDSRPDARSNTDRCADRGMLSQEAVEALMEETVERLVADPGPDAVLDVVGFLDGAGSLWQGVLFVLGPIASRPLPGCSEPEAVARLARLADTPDRISALTFRTWAEFRAQGTAAARDVWEAAPDEVRRGAAAQLLVQYCWSVGGDAGTLTPQAAVRLLRAVVPVTWLPPRG